jgi:hypothetical protein
VSQTAAHTANLLTVEDALNTRLKNSLSNVTLPTAPANAAKNPEKTAFITQAARVSFNDRQKLAAA